MRAILFFAIVFFTFGCERETSVDISGRGEKQERSDVIVPQHVISTVPSITDTFIALGLEDKLVGVSDFCVQPEVADLPKLGGLLDQNREAVLALEPDLIIVLAEDVNRVAFYRKFGIDVVCVDQTSVAGILESLSLIASPFGPEASERAVSLRNDILYRLSYIEDSTESLYRPRTLICLDRSYELPGLNGLYVVGNQQSYIDAVEIAGGRNALGKSEIGVPLISSEMILRMNPEVIIDISRSIEPGEKNTRLEDWEKLGNEVDAVRNRRIYAITENYACNPGPRFELFIERLAKILHPEIFEKEIHD